jgi:hypothetical protein
MIAQTGGTKKNEIEPVYNKHAFIVCNESNTNIKEFVREKI